MTRKERLLKTKKILNAFHKGLISIKQVSYNLKRVCESPEIEFLLLVELCNGDENEAEDAMAFAYYADLKYPIK